MYTTQKVRPPFIFDPTDVSAARLTSVGHASGSTQKKKIKVIRKNPSKLWLTASGARSRRVFVLLCCIKPILGNRYGPGVIP